MNVFHKVTRESLKKNRTRTAVTVIGIALSTALMTAVTASVSSVRQYLMQNEIARNGAYHVSVTELPTERYATVAAAEEISEIAYAEPVGYAIAGSANTYKPYLYIMGISPNFTDLAAVQLTAGHMPENPQEILLPEHLSYNGGVYWKIGDTLTLSIGDRMLEQYALTQHNPYTPPEELGEDGTAEVLVPHETKTYTVCGFYERPGFEEYSAPGYSCLTLDDNGKPDAAYADVWYTLVHPRKVYDYTDKEFVKLTWDNSYVHSELLMYMGISRFSGYLPVLYGMAAILLGLIVFGSVSLIYNAFAISVSERTRQYGMLSSVGATKKQLRHMVRYEAFCVGVIGIPAGILLGLAGITVTFLCIGNRFSGLTDAALPMRLHVSWVAMAASLLISVVTIYISALIPSRRATRVTAVEAVRQSKDIFNPKRPIKTPKWIYKHFGLPGVLGQKYFQRSKKRYRATVFSLFMSVVLFIASAGFTHSLQSSVESVFGAGTYDLYYWSGINDINGMTPTELNELFRSEPLVDASALSMLASAHGSMDKSVLTADGYKAEYLFTNVYDKDSEVGFFMSVEFVDDETFRNFLREQNLPERSYMDAGNPRALVLDQVVTYDEEKRKYREIHALNCDTLDFHAMFRREIEGYHFDRYYYEDQADATADYVYASDTEGEPELTLSEEEAQFSRTLTGDVLHVHPYFVETQGYIVFLYPMSAMDTILAGTEKPDTLSCVMLAGDHLGACKALHQTLGANHLTASNLFDNAKDRENERSIIVIVRVFSCGFIILISLIAAANVFNSISTNIGLRRREFAMLRSIGMTGKSLMRMMHYECLICGTKALLLGLPVSFGVILLLFAVVHQGFESGFTIPWAAVGIAVLSVFAVVSASMLYAMQKVKQENPMDALKSENF